MFHFPLPALGLIPHGCSALLAVFDLGWLERLHTPKYRIVLSSAPDEHARTAKRCLRPVLVALFDAFCGLALLGVFIGSYLVLEGGSWYEPASAMILGTWATLPFLVNM